MTQQEYEQKKMECWHHLAFNYHRLGDIPKAAFDYIFDRAYTLGKQTETISQEEIEKATKKYAAEVDKNIRDLYGNIPDAIMFGDCAAESFREGVKFALGKQSEVIAQEEIEKMYRLPIGKQEKDEDPVIQGWAARDEDGALCIYEYKPKRVYDTWAHENVWIGEILLRNVHTKPFFNLTWEDEPQEVEITIKRKKK